MFLDLNAEEPWNGMPECMSCKGPIGPQQQTEHLRMPFDPEHKLHELNGIYHAECARPYLSIARALEMLNRGFF